MPRVPRVSRQTLEKRQRQYQFLKLVGEQGMSISLASKELCISVSTVYAWRKRDFDFEKELLKILDRPEHRDRMKHKGSVTRLRTSDGDPLSDWKMQFLRLLESDHTRVEALQILDKTAREVDEALTEDEIFRRDYEEIQLCDEWEIVDNLRRRAKGSSNDARAYLAFRKEKASKEDPGSSSGDLRASREKAKAKVEARCFVDPREVPLAQKPGEDVN